MSVNIEQINQLEENGIPFAWKLTDKKQKFALAYIKTGGDRAKSLKLAGYKPKKDANNIAATACRILKDPILQQYIAKVRLELETKLKLDAEWVLKRHERVVNAFIPLDEEVLLDVKEVSCAQSSLDGICKVGGLYKKPEEEKPVDDSDIEKAKEYARQHAKEF